MSRLAGLASVTIILILGSILCEVAPANANTTEWARSRDVVFTEIASALGNSASSSFFELRNVGTKPVDLTGWNVFRCDGEGLRSGINQPETSLDGVVLAPQQILTVAKAGSNFGAAHIDKFFSQSFAHEGIGLVLQNPAMQLVDAISVYPDEPWPTQSECTFGENLPNILDPAAGESWQRVANTGAIDRDFIVATATPGADNQTVPTRGPSMQGGIAIDEVAPFGPGSWGADLVELANHGASTVDIGGWSVYSCNEMGYRNPTPDFSIPAGTQLASGKRFALGGPDSKRDSSIYGGYLSTSLSNVSFGVQLRTGSGELVDEVAVSPYSDSSCQSSKQKLPARLDAVRGESYQRVQFTGDPDHDFIVAPRTDAEPNARTEDSLASNIAESATSVALSEVATDPGAPDLPSSAVQQNFITLANFGTDDEDISGWRIFRCQRDGLRSLKPQIVIADGTILRPGATFLAARDGTEAANSADATYSIPLNFLGSGVWVETAKGEKVDSVGIFHVNEMDSTLDVPSPCTNSVSLVTFAPDRLLAESYHRVAFTGVDAKDFSVARSSLVPALSSGAARQRSTDDKASAKGTADNPATAEPTAESGVNLTAAPTFLSVVPRQMWTGFTDGAALATERGTSETEVTESVTTALFPVLTDSGYRFPYLRLVLANSASGAFVVRGTAITGQEIQLSIWEDEKSTWSLLIAGDADAAGTFELASAIPERAGPHPELLVQAGPRTEKRFAEKPNGEFENPENYDLAISHITDTQYLTESYPAVYDHVVDWIVKNATQRKIAFATHTGDIVQNWVDPNQPPERAILEFERASNSQAILDNAGIANSVLPGNHDSLRGMDMTLFNTYFGPARYASTAWYQGSIGPNDNSSNYSTFERAGAKFLMLSISYGFGERELAWATDVVESHPDYNVIISTHEHVTPKTVDQPAGRSTSKRWLSRGDLLWSRVVAPHRNVVLVLSGHYHGVGKIQTENAGGIAGHSVVELVADYQEFRTETGERATGFQRLLQIDLSAGSVSVNTFSQRLNASASYPYDYMQFLPEIGRSDWPANGRPWNIVARGLQNRYSPLDDEFVVPVLFQYEKSLAVSEIGFVDSTDSADATDLGAAGTSHRITEFSLGSEMPRS